MSNRFYQLLKPVKVSNSMVRDIPIPWAKVRVAPIADLRRYLHKDSQPRQPAKPKPLVLPRTVRRPLTTGQRMLVVTMRWEGWSWKDIQKSIGVHANTCQSVFRQYYVNGETPVKKKPTGRPPHPIPEDIREYLLSSLTHNRFLSLRERVKDI